MKVGDKITREIDMLIVFFIIIIGFQLPLTAWTGMENNVSAIWFGVISGVAISQTLRRVM